MSGGFLAVYELKCWLSYLRRGQRRFYGWLGKCSGMLHWGLSPSLTRCTRIQRGRSWEVFLQVFSSLPPASLLPILHCVSPPLCSQARGPPASFLWSFSRILQRKISAAPALCLSLQWEGAL